MSLVFVCVAQMGLSYIQYPDCSAIHSQYHASTFNFIAPLVILAVSCKFIPTLVYALYPVIRSNSVWVTSCNRKMSIT